MASQNTKSRSKKSSNNDSSLYPYRGSISSRGLGLPWKAILGTTALAGAAGITWYVLKSKDTAIDDFVRDDFDDEDDDDYNAADYDDDDYTETYGGVL